MSDPNTCEHDFVCTMCLQSRPDFPTTRAKYEADLAALRAQLETTVQARDSVTAELISMETDLAALRELFSEKGGGDDDG